MRYLLTDDKVIMSKLSNYGYHFLGKQGSVFVFYNNKNLPKVEGVVETNTRIIQGEDKVAKTIFAKFISKIKWCKFKK